MDKNYKTVPANDCHQGVGLFLGYANIAVVVWLEPGTASLGLGLSQFVLPLQPQGDSSTLKMPLHLGLNLHSKTLGGKERAGVEVFFPSSLGQWTPEVRVNLGSSEWFTLPDPRETQGHISTSFWLLLGEQKLKNLHLAQHFHTPRSSSDMGWGQEQRIDLKSHGGGGWRQLNPQYIQSIRCIFIRQYKSLCINKAEHQGSFN